MIMLNSLECTLAQTRMVGRVALSTKGPMRGQYAFVMAKSQSFFIGFLFSVNASGDSACICLK